MSNLTSQFEGKATSGESAVAVVNSYDVVIAAIDVQAYSRYTIYAYNAGGGGGADITSIKLQTAPTASSNVWTDVGEVLEANLESEQATYTTFTNQALKFVRVLAKTSASTTTAKFWFCAGEYVG